MNFVWQSPQQSNIYILFLKMLFALSLLTVASAYKSELVLKDPKIIGEVVKNAPRMVDDLPEAWDWRTKGLMTTDLNQHIPVYCGSCWAHSAFSSIADRMKIMTNGTQRDVIPSIQALINCGDAGTCQGGDSNAANKWVYDNGIPDVTCQQYQAQNMECSAINTCKNCDHDPDVGCSAVKEYPVIKVTEYGSVTGDRNIQSEIYTRGPVSAYLNAECIEDYKGGVNMYDTCNGRMINHAIQLNGWGVEADGTEYWIGRNSWGTYWGEHGFFRIVRGGKFNPGTAYWAVPEVENFE